MSERPGPSSPPLPDSFHTDLTVGEILRRTRTHYNISFARAEQDLRIKAEHLEALEHNALESLPGRVYVFGYVRTYSEYLGLDGEKMLALLRKQSGRKVEKVRHVRTLPEEDEEEQKEPGWQITAASGVALLLALIVIGSFSGTDRPQEIPTVPKQLSDSLTVQGKPKPEPESEPTQEAATEAPPQPVAETPKAHPVVLRALGNTWLEIRDASRKVVFSRVLNQGEEYWVPVEQTDLSMTLGNAGGLEIVVDGKALPLLGAQGQVRRNVSLNAEALRGKKRQ